MKQIGVIGASNCSNKIYEMAYKVGELIAKNGFVLVNGGLGGVMEASSKGALNKGGLTVGIIPYSDRGEANSYVKVVIATNMGHARNMIIVHSCDSVISVGGGYGTASETAIALKEGKKVVAIEPTFMFPNLLIAKSPEEAIKLIKED